MMEGDRTSGGKRAIGHTDVAVESRAPVINKYPPHAVGSPEVNKYPPHAVGSCRVRHALWHLLGLAFRRQPHHGGPSSHGPTNALPAPGVDGSPAECGAQQAERAEARPQPRASLRAGRHPHGPPSPLTTVHGPPSPAHDRPRPAVRRSPLESEGGGPWSHTALCALPVAVGC